MHKAVPPAQLINRENASCNHIQSRVPPPLSDSSMSGVARIDSKCPRGRDKINQSKLLVQLQGSHLPT